MFERKTLRPRLRWLVQPIGVAAVIALLPATVGAAPAVRTDDVESLTARADRIAAELDDLASRSSLLDEEYNLVVIDVEAAEAKLGKVKKQVDDAAVAFDKTTDEAKSIAIEAYVGSADADLGVLSASDLTEKSSEETFLAIAHGDRTQVLEDMSASREDLDLKTARLTKQQGEVDALLDDLEQARSELDSIIERQTNLLDDVKGELADAVEAKRVERARAQAEQNRREAAEAQQRAQASSRAAALAVTVRPPATAPAQSNAAPTPPPVTVPAPPPQWVPAEVAPNSAGEKAVATAMAQLGDPYVWAASGPNSFDCSGLVQYAYASAGRSLPHSSRALRSMSQHITESQLQRGDLVFGGYPVHHVAIYIGGGQMVHAPSSGDVVKVSGIYAVTSKVSFGRI